MSQPANRPRRLKRRHDKAGAEAIEGESIDKQGEAQREERESKARASALIESKEFQDILEIIRQKRNGNENVQHRHSSYGPEIVKVICEARASGLPLKDAAALGGISYKTLAEWRADPEKSAFADALARAEAMWTARMVLLIEAHAYEDWRAPAFLLERLKPAEFGLKQTVEHEHSGHIEHKVDVNFCKLIGDSFAQLLPQLKNVEKQALEVVTETVKDDDTPQV